MKLLRDCVVLALVGGAVYFWTHRPVPQRAPAIAGVRPNLSMPAGPAGPAVPGAGSSMLVAKESTSGGDAPRLAGKPKREQALGDKPDLLGEGAADVTGGRASEPLPDEQSPWEERLRQPWAVGAVVGLFIMLYALLTRALRRGPGGHGFTHD